MLQRKDSNDKGMWNGGDRESNRVIIHPYVTKYDDARTTMVIITKSCH